MLVSKHRCIKLQVVCNVNITQRSVYAPPTGYSVPLDTHRDPDIISLSANRDALTSSDI